MVELLSARRLRPQTPRDRGTLSSKAYIRKIVLSVENSNTDAVEVLDILNIAIMILIAFRRTHY